MFSPHARSVAAVTFALAIGASLVVACSHDGREMREPTGAQAESIATIPATDSAAAVIDTEASVAEVGGEFTVTAPWIDGGAIVTPYTCVANSERPAVSWSGAPTDTVALAVVMIDTTLATTDSVGFVHWAVTNIDASVLGIDSTSLPSGAIEATNDAGNVGYTPPCPPAGEPHTYVIEVHALSQLLDVSSGTPAADLVQAIDAATIATASVSGAAIL